MHPFDSLREVLSHINQAPSEVTTQQLQALPPDDNLPSAWITWVLIACIRHEARQRWLMKIVRTGMGPLSWKLGRGIVPTLTEWEFRFHGNGCCLTNRLSGEVIDVDFHDADGTMIDIYFYIKFLKSLRQPEPPEDRLIQLYPSFSTVRLAMAELWAIHLVEAPAPVTNVYALSKKTRALAPMVEAFMRAWQTPSNRLWLGALIGDWLAAHEAAIASGNETLIAATAPRAEACRKHYVARLQETFDADDDDLANEAFLALHDHGTREEIHARLEETLTGPLSCRTTRALEIISKQCDAAWSPSVENLWKRLDPNGEPPEPFLWTKCVDLLVGQNSHKDEILAALPKAGGTEITNAAVLALERAPEHALPLFRRALRSRDRCNRNEAAAVLALIDQPWCRSELLAVLAESDDQEATAECRAALLESRDHNIYHDVNAWEAKHPAEQDTESDGETSSDFMARVAAGVSADMAQWHDRVMPLRNVSLQNSGDVADE